MQLKSSGEGTFCRITGLAIGLVSNNQDEEGLGRVKLLLPWMGEGVESHWARVVQPMAGKGRGFWFLPEVGDECLVGFEHGDVTRPFVLGVLWNEKDRPPSLYDVFCPQCVEDPAHIDTHKGAFNADGKNDKKYIRSRSGHMIVFDDNSGVTVSDKTGKHRFDLITEEKKVKISNADGNNLLNCPAGSMNLSAKEVVVQVLGDATLGSHNVVVIKSGGTTTFDSRANLELKAGGVVGVKAGAALNVQGSKGEVTGAGSFGCEAGGVANIYAGGVCNLVGAPVGLQMPGAPVVIAPSQLDAILQTLGAALGGAGMAGAAPMMGMEAAGGNPAATAAQVLAGMGQATGTATVRQVRRAVRQMMRSAGVAPGGAPGGAPSGSGAPSDSGAPSQSSPGADPNSPSTPATEIRKKIIEIADAEKAKGIRDGNPRIKEYFATVAGLTLAKYETFYTPENIKAQLASWCNGFACYCWKQAGASFGGDSPSLTKVVAGLKAQGRIIGANDTPGVGDMIFWGSGTSFHHIGLVKSVSGGQIRTIEGNISDGIGERGLDRKDLYGFGKVD